MLEASIENMPLLELAQTISGSKTFSVSQKFDDFIDLKAIAEPSSPASGYIRLFIDSGDGKIKIKRSNGDVVIIE